MTMIIFSERLKELRNLKTITQKQLAIEIGMSETGYQHYERGTREPSLTNIVKLAKYFEVSSDYLLGLSDNPIPNH